jgi:transposase
VDEKRRPLSRFSVGDVCLRAENLGLHYSYSTLWRLLHRDAIRPWLQQQWLFPRDPLFLEKATPVLGLYHRHWQGEPLGPRDFVLCADEMTGLQALSRIHTGLAPAPGRPARYEFEYERHGTLCYLAFLDVFTGCVTGATSSKSGIEPFERTLAKVLAQRRYQEAERIFLIVDNGSSHHPSTSPARIRDQFPPVEVVHLPTHSSWLNQIEIYFSIVRRKALSPANFVSKAALRERLASFQCHYNRRAAPFTWNYTHQQLERHLEKFAAYEAEYAEAQAALARHAASSEREHWLTN